MTIINSSKYSLYKTLHTVTCYPLCLSNTNIFNIHIWPIDQTQIGTSTLAQSGPGVITSKKYSTAASELKPHHLVVFSEDLFLGGLNTYSTYSKFHRHGFRKRRLHYDCIFNLSILRIHNCIINLTHYPHIQFSLFWPKSSIGSSRKV